MKRNNLLILFLLTLSLLFTGCSCSKHMKRLAIRCPELFETKKIVDTIIIPEYKIDTFFTISTIVKDTIIYDDSRVNSIIYTEPSLDVTGRLKVRNIVTVKQDTIYKEKIITVPLPCNEKHFTGFQRVFFIIGVIGVVLLIIYIIYHIIKRLILKR
ncbi:MAG TPA: hypothetical protein PLL02_01015 [Bacteroidales bacterium]|nr:hypothetical protein [Bacteroidales bacterium]